MNHYFKVEVARDFGPEVALFVNRMMFVDSEDGWITCSLTEFGKIFPYWTMRERRTVIANSIKSGLVTRRNMGSGRTCQYKLTPKALEYYKED